MKHPVLWGTVFLVAGLLFLGLAHGSAADGNGPLTSQAPDGDGDVEGQIASKAHLGISLVSTVAGVALVLLALFCYGSRLMHGSEGSEGSSDS